jgi:hypothetical protein
MTFEEWWGKRTVNEEYGLSVTDMKASWDAATYAANTRAGDAGNEAEKDARRNVAVIQLNALIPGEVLTAEHEVYVRQRLDAIIKEAQG